MGNRACVVFFSPGERSARALPQISPAVYLHWNGGPESVYAFLDEMKRRRVRPEVDLAAALFVHVCRDFFDQDEAGSLSLRLFNAPDDLGLDSLSRFAHEADDNGVYLVNLDAAPWTVRRFILGRRPWTEVRELTTAEVNTERDQAYRHPYHTGDESGDTIAKCFLRLRPKIAPYG